MDTLSPNNESEIVRATPGPWYLVELGFTTPMRLSNKTTANYDGNAYAGSNLQISFNPDGTGTLSLFNEKNAYAPTFLSEKTAGRSAKVWIVYGDGSNWSPGDADLRFDGEMGGAAPGRTIVLEMLKKKPAKKIPNLYFTPSNGFNHVPKTGTEIATNNGTFVIQ